MKTRSSWIAALFAAAIVIVSAACSSASGAVPAAAGGPQAVRAVVKGSPKRLNVCAKCLKAGKVTRAV